MKQTLFAVLASLCFLCGQSAAAEPSQLRVLCYNIHYGQGNDGKYDLKRLAAVINKAKPEGVTSLVEVQNRSRVGGYDENSAGISAEPESDLLDLLQ